MRLTLAAAIFALATSALAQGDLRGHGGPVRALSVSADGARAISGSFDQSAIVWRLDSGRAEAILRVHEGPVNAVLALREGFLTGGEDGRVALWTSAQSGKPAAIVQLHEGPIVALALALDGGAFASASWDGRVKVSALADLREARRFEGHAGNVNGVAFLPGGRTIVSGGYDATVRFWPREGGAATVVQLASPVNTLAVTRDGVIAAGCSNGQVVLLDAEGREIASIAATETPVTSLAASPDGAMIAAASPRGAVALVDVAARRVRFTLNGPGLPVWSLVFTPDGQHILTGGADRIVRRWDALSGEHIGAIAGAGEDDDLAAYRDMRGAEVFRACAVCHTLRADGAGRAGPTLYGIFGRKAGTLPGYNYSEAFKKLDLVWTEETVSRLFEIGPQAYTPGTKMPEQTLGNAQERLALIEFLRAAAAKK